MASNIYIHKKLIIYFYNVTTSDIPIYSINNNSNETNSGVSIFAYIDSLAMAAILSILVDQIQHLNG